MKHTRRLLAAAAMLVTGSASWAQQAPPPGMPVPPPGLMEHLRELQAKFNATPDTPGDGAYPAIKEEVASLPDHVVYRPADLSKLGGHKLPILVWGNGGCSADGASGRLHLAEFASHGYHAIANGTIKSGPGAPPQPPMPMPQPGQPMQLPPPETTASQLTQAIDWAIKENARPDSPFYGKLDTNAIAVSGWSCGGVQALTIATSDPRIKAVIIHDSGLFSTPAPMPGMDLPKSALDRLHTPILYVLGGPSDIAYANGMDDYARITKVPAAVVNIGDVGHGGTFYDPNGGKAAQIALAWLDWRLKGDAEAKRMFVGADCGLCRDPQLQLEKKGID
jgi:dienelactone hydrolase